MTTERTEWWARIDNLRKISSMAWTIEGQDGYSDLTERFNEVKIPDYAEFADKIEKQIYAAIINELDEDSELMDGVLDYIDSYFKKKIEEKRGGRHEQ